MSCMTPGMSIEAFLARAKIFSGMERETRAALARRARFLRRRRGALLYSDAVPRVALFLLVEGHAALAVHTPSDAGTLVELLGPGDTFGEELLLGGHHRDSCVRLLTDASLIAMPGAAVLAALNGSAPFRRALLENFARRTLAMWRRLQWRSTRGVPERIAGWLMEQLPAKGDGPFEIRLPIRKADLAALLGMTSATLSRALARLRREQRLGGSGRLLGVPRAARLAEVCAASGGCRTCAACPRGGSWRG